MASNRLTIEPRSVESLVPYVRNARTHSDTQVAQIAGSIREYGWTNPILIDPENGIIAGHGRALAARKLGMAEVPCIVLSGLSAAQKRALVLADNKLALNAGWDNDLLKLELADLRDDGYDIGLTGFSTEEVSELLQLDDADSAGSGSGSGGAGSLAAKFGVPPFSVLNAREGWWQDRKRAWLALGIRSEVGRGAAPGGAPMPMDRANATPGGSRMPAADYSKTKARGDGRGRSQA